MFVYQLVLCVYVFVLFNEFRFHYFLLNFACDVLSRLVDARALIHLLRFYRIVNPEASFPPIPAGESC